MEGAKVIGAPSQKDVDLAVRGRIKNVLIIGQLDLAVFVAKAYFAPVCRVSNVATSRRAAHCTLLCRTATTASIMADVNVGLQPRRRFTAELRRTGNITIQCGEVDLVGARGRVNAITPCGAARGAVS